MCFSWAYFVWLQSWLQTVLAALCPLPTLSLAHRVFLSWPPMKQEINISTLRRYRNLPYVFEQCPPQSLLRSVFLVTVHLPTLIIGVCKDSSLRMLTSLYSTLLRGFKHFSYIHKSHFVCLFFYISSRTSLNSRIICLQIRLLPEYPLDTKSSIMSSTVDTWLSFPDLLPPLSSLSQLGTPTHPRLFAHTWL